MALSFFLYYICGTAGFFILPAVGIVSYVVTVAMEKSHSASAKKALLISGITLLIVLMAIYRYTAINKLAPLGLSFFALEAISYISDCYNGKIKAEKNPLYVLLFIAFFPTVISGPIERGGNLIPQFRKLDSASRKELFDINRLCDNAIIIIFGMFVKLVIADRLAILSDHIFTTYYRYGTSVLIIGAVSFGMQLYCDFMAYSHIALGIAGMFDIKIMDNFKAPYMSLSITDFWRRWHISLSSWLKDYIYIPLGGNRKGKLRKYLNTFITFAISGVWHGSGLTFLIWGVLHGLYNMIENILTDIGIMKKNKSNMPFGARFLRATFTFILVDFAWIFFKADSVQHACSYIIQMFTVKDFWILSDMNKFFSLGLGAQELFILIFALMILGGMDLIAYKRDIRIDQWLNIQGPVFRMIFTLAILLYTMVFGLYGEVADPASFYYMSF
ncbi:MAG: MBOAT family protein [Butyrivibrio sp.]|nr:MBOAT family protein [Butyrivibrio sp.]